MAEPGAGEPSQQASRPARRAPGGVVAGVEPGSAAEAAGLRPGDQLIRINGHRLRDVIDVQFYGAEEHLTLLVERDGLELALETERAYGQPLGLSFSRLTFDVDVRRCTNNCDFCFVKMNAPGMRRSLYVKDDDYRHSFLSGSFVTLTNLKPSDWARLEEQRLSPLYVSVHATEPDLRRRLLRRADAPDILDQLRRLAELDIQVHAQVVLLPGINDGANLERTLADLLALHHAPVLSVSVVPVGLTRYHTGPCRTYTPDEARQVLDDIEPWRERCRQVAGCTFVYPSDEWYLVAGRPIPAADEYDGFPQAENGVGMVRLLLEEWAELKPGQTRQRYRSATLICGTLIAPVMRQIVQEWSELSGASLRVLPVVNQFFGPVTTVSGLLTGQDVIASARGQRLGEVVLLPRAMFTGRYSAADAPPDVTLDDMTPAQIADGLGARIELAGSLREAMAVLADRPPPAVEGPPGAGRAQV